MARDHRHEAHFDTGWRYEFLIVFYEINPAYNWRNRASTGHNHTLSEAASRLV